MKTLNLAGLAVLSQVYAKIHSDMFFRDQAMHTELSQYAKELAKKPNEENPIFLDADHNNLFPSKILSTFSSPQFIGPAPPGITAFMVSQVFLSGERKGGFKYPLFLKSAIESFSKKNRLIVKDVCAKVEIGKADCPAGYKKVVLKDSTSKASSGADGKDSKIVETNAEAPEPVN